MSTLDVSNLAPGDAVAALRSYPRRFAALLHEAPEPDVDLDARAGTAGPDGASALDVVAGVTRTWVALGEALGRIVATDTPVVDRAVADPAARTWEAPVPATVAEVLTDLESQATALADRVGHVPTELWGRTATVEGGGQVSALDVARQAVKVGRDGLDRVERALAAVDG